MRRGFLVIIITLLCTLMFAQVPESFNYQAIPRDGSGEVYPNQAMMVRIIILEDSPSGSSVYTETFNPTTTSLGSLNLQIGQGTPVSGTFSTIPWGSTSYYLKVEIDPTGGTTYIEMGTTELISVPYAFVADKAISLVGADGMGEGSLLDADLLDGHSSEYFIEEPGHYLGEEYLGGVIFYLYTASDGSQKGLVVSKTEALATWCNTVPNLTGADRTYDGLFNTDLMPNEAGAARYWVETTLGGDWYVPSIDELNLLWENRFHVNSSGVSGLTLLSTTKYYWSSTESGENGGYCFVFKYGYGESKTKTNSYTVRGIKAF